MSGRYHHLTDAERLAVIQGVVDDQTAKCRVLEVEYWRMVLQRERVAAPADPLVSDAHQFDPQLNALEQRMADSHKVCVALSALLAAHTAKIDLDATPPVAISPAVKEPPGQAKK